MKINHSGIRIFLISIFILITPIVFAQEDFVCVGEKFTYEVRLLGFKIGTQIDQVLGKEIINTEETYHLKSEIKTNPFFSKFYYLSEQIDSWVRTSNLLPVRTITDIDRGKYRRHYEFSVNQTNKKATIFNKQNQETKEINITANTLDSLSLIYYLRNQELKVGNLYNFNLLTRSGTEQVKVAIVKEEKMTTPYGNFTALMAKQVGAETDIVIWFATDKTHTPVKIAVKTEAGLLSAYLCKKSEK
ncbi:MAG: DUF3108 domain-containing protein [bacterium]|nr:DUF3108 domain-containing protein [bacterium]